MDDAALASLATRHPHGRFILHGALPLATCRELSAILAALGVVGYRPCVRSLTVHDLLLAQPQLLAAVATARQAIWDAVEEQFSLPCSTWPETTSLIAWTRGASIGWHHDANRPYLAARHLSAVAYLNTQGEDFQGGTFCFQDPPLRVAPSAGMLLLYTADERSVHAVEEVTAGQRCTLTMWFTLDAEHQEDPKVLSKLSARGTGLPSTMHELQGGGGDVRLAQLQQVLGLTLKPCTCAAGGAAAAAEADGSQEQQPECLVVECCLQGCPQCSRPACAGRVHFSSVQEAALALHMLHARLPCCAGHAGGDVAQPPGGCHAAVVRRLPEARPGLQQYLQQRGEQLEALLPVWHELGALVPPPSSELAL